MLPEIQNVKHKTIKEYPNYQIYDNGMVYSKFRKRWKVPHAGKHGHLQVYLENENGHVYALLHRLVYETFIGPIEKGMIIHHQDSNHNNNNYTNLVLVSRAKHTSIHKVGNLNNLGRHPSEQIRNKISNTLKKYHAQKRGQ